MYSSAPPTSLAKPKSDTFAILSSPMRIFLAAKSRWTNYCNENYPIIYLTSKSCVRVNKGFLEVFVDGNLSENSVHFYDNHAGAVTKNTTITLYAW